MNNESVSKIRVLLGIGSPIQKILDSFGQKKGALFHISGRSNSGKSEFTQMITEALSADGNKCAFFDIENSGWHNLQNRHNRKSKIVSKIMNKKVDIFFPVDEAEFYEQINACIKENYSCIVIDYLNLLTVNSSDSLNKIPDFLKKTARENEIFIAAALNGSKSTALFAERCEKAADYFAFISKDDQNEIFVKFLKPKNTPIDRISIYLKDYK